MGLFSKLRSANQPVSQPNIPRAVLTPAVIAMLSDGNVDDAELAQLENLASYSGIFRQFSGEQLGRMVLAIIEDIKQEGPDAMLKSAATALSPGLRETAFCFVVRLVLADGRIEEGEKIALGATSEALQLPFETATKIIEVMIMLQRCE